MNPLRWGTIITLGTLAVPLTWLWRELSLGMILVIMPLCGDAFIDHCVIGAYLAIAMVIAGVALVCLLAVARTLCSLANRRNDRPFMERGTLVALAGFLVGALVLALALPLADSGVSRTMRTLLEQLPALGQVLALVAFASLSR